MKGYVIYVFLEGMKSLLKWWLRGNWIVNVRNEKIMRLNLIEKNRHMKTNDVWQLTRWFCQNFLFMWHKLLNTPNDFFF